jgi:hypothetical protein
MLMWNMVMRYRVDKLAYTNTESHTHTHTYTNTHTQSHTNIHTCKQCTQYTHTHT